MKIHSNGEGNAGEPGRGRHTSPFSALPSSPLERRRRINCVDEVLTRNGEDEAEER